MNVKEKISYGEWNIGFIDSPSSIIQQKMPSICWLKHDYKYCGFADPFIYRVSNSIIELFVEQINYYRKNARLVRLLVDKKTKTLLDVKSILELPSHLSYPFIVRKEKNVYVLPENVASGKWKLYRYCEDDESLQYEKTISDLPLADATILKANSGFYLFATKRGADNCDLYLWRAENVFDDYKPVDGVLLKSDYSGSRMAGECFEWQGKLYRPAQDCKSGYGKGLILYEVVNLDLVNYKEVEVARFYPNDKYYPDGLHTLNSYAGVTVVDGYKLHYNPIVRLIKKFNH